MSEVKESPQKRKHVEYQELMHFYRLSHLDLDLVLRELKTKIDEELENFKVSLMSVLNNINYVRYMQAFPQDDIRFIFRETVNASLTENRFEQKAEILHRMMNFEVIKQDHAGISDNCVWELKKTLALPSVLDFKSLCPSGSSFLQRYQTIAEQFLPFWKNDTGAELNLTSIFKEVSPIFPKEQLNKLGSVLAQTNKSVLSSRLIFRASEHSFQSALFKEACVGIGNTLMLAKSEKGKVFGAFSPAKWLNTKEKQYVGDPTASSFLFSLDSNQVFPIKKNQLDYAISAYGDWGPIYGSPYGPDLSISDKCHLNDRSCSSLGSHYTIPPNIKEYSNEAFNLLAGAKKFKVIEYELYELVFE